MSVNTYSTVALYTNLKVPVGSGLPASSNTNTVVANLGISIVTSNTASPVSSDINYILTDHYVNITATGLKPSTVHTLQVTGANTTNVSSYCKPYGGVLGGPLVTDNTGSIQFTYFYNSQISTQSSVSATQSLINKIDQYSQATSNIGTSYTLYLSSADNTSYTSINYGS